MLSPAWSAYTSTGWRAFGTCIENCCGAPRCGRRKEIRSAEVLPLWVMAFQTYLLN